MEEFKPIQPKNEGFSEQFIETGEPTKIDVLHAKEQTKTQKKLITLKLLLEKLEGQKYKTKIEKNRIKELKAWIEEMKS